MANYIWPLNKSTTPDVMNTSFGPRIDENKWDFHDGIDLPAPLGTEVYAMRAGTVHRAGPGGTDGYSSRHVVLEVDDPDDGLMYLVHVHLHSIADGITVGANVTQGQLLGTVGEDDATYPHLHMEFRRGGPSEICSVHPLGYLPYSDTANLTAPVVDRFNRLADNLMAARLLFGAISKLEGDLQRVEVDLLSGTTLLEQRVVDFNDKNTINEGNDDEKLFKHDIGVEGYQKSDMVKDGREDLQYGILVGAIPANCDALMARVIDIGGNIATSAPIPVPDQTATNQEVDFEDLAMPPAGWGVRTSGAGTSVTNDLSASHVGVGGMLSIDSSAANVRQRACIVFEMPAGRFEWLAKGSFNPSILSLDPGQTIDFLHFRNSSVTKLSVAARIFRGTGNVLRAGIIVKHPNGTESPSISADGTVVIEENTWREWELRVLRIGTRETTAILSLENDEKLRINWDSTVYEPGSLRAGIGQSSAGVTATVLTDDLLLTESLP